MLPKSNRIGRQKDFARIFKFGQLFKEGGLVLKSLKDSRLPVSRLAIIISLKVAKKHVLRNKMKRFLTQQVEAFWPRLAPGHLITLKVAQGFDKEHYPEIKEALIGLFKKAKLLK